MFDAQLLSYPHTQNSQLDVSKMRPFLAVDLDGTLCNSAHLGKKYFPKDGVPDFEGFYSNLANVDIHAPMLNLLDAWTHWGLGWEVWTARGEVRGREVTERWLQKQRLYPTAIRMNQHNDNYVSAPEIKKQYITDFGRPYMVFDDDLATIEMFKAEGIPTFQVTIPGA